ncbi:hypothetical protein MNBD_PLANCTO02-609 [hydrothermal vent metagenome]|uniref:Biopolymer transport protein ExbD/TolR n=1 Tax=hydrothermal vent metagenome TaxID=652676 RepID=A0A3B1E5Q0_9ZZZZ
MAPMIDVVFQLLIFFMLTLNITEPEGDFSINMPISAPAANQSNALQDLKIRLEATEDGRLKNIIFGRRPLGNNTGKQDNVFARLNAEVNKHIGNSDDATRKEMRVIIDADYNLDYKWTIKTISACTGKMKEGKLIHYFEKIEFAPQRPQVKIE